MRVALGLKTHPGWAALVVLRQPGGMFCSDAKFLHDAPSDRVALARRDLEERHHQDLEALVLEAAAVQPRHWATEEVN